MVKAVRFDWLDEPGYARLTEGGRVLEADRHGAKLLALGDGRYLKLFRRKRLLSSALMWPYSRRFQRNAERLGRLGIPTVVPERLLRIPHLRRTAVLYRPLAGRTLRELLADAADREPWIDRFGGFLGELHGRGIYFRSLHFGNLVVGDAGSLGLIDVADLEFRSAPLRAGLVARNLRHLMRYPADWIHIRGAEAAFRRGYAAAGRPLPVPAQALLSRFAP
jgi:tRNA A-37 threonylcarbamoyl transferase component Bud32